MKRLSWALWVLVPLVFPAVVVLGAGDLVIGRRSLDLVGHVWTMWVTSEGALTRTELAAYPEGADLLPILGGWLDIFVASILTRVFGVSVLLSYNLVVGLWLAVSGWGGSLLARVLGASPLAALVAGVVLQLDGYGLHHLEGGRTEQGGLGFVALALAGALSIWRSGSRWAVLGCGVAGALVVFLSWEHGLWLMLSMFWLGLFLLSGVRPPGAVQRWLSAAAVTLVLAGPWAGLFLSRASAVRALDEGQETLSWAVESSVAPLGWLLQPVRPAVMGLLALLLLPWTVRALDRRLWVGVGTGLLLSLVLASGPSPGLWQPGDLAAGHWGPFAWMQSLPVLGWFHTPDRLMVGWSLAAAVAAALLVDRLWRVRVGLGIAGLLAVLAVSVGHVERGQLWLSGGWRPGGPPALSVLAAAPGAGAVLDLPPAQAGMDAMQYTIFQLIHGRPIPYHMTLPFLTRDAYGRLSSANPTLRWLGHPAGTAPPDSIQADVQRLAADGIRWVILHPNRLPPRGRLRAIAAFESALGEPVLSDRPGWLCWEIRDRPQ